MPYSRKRALARMDRSLDSRRFPAVYRLMVQYVSKLEFERATQIRQIEISWLLNLPPRFIHSGVRFWRLDFPVGRCQRRELARSPWRSAAPDPGADGTRRRTRKVSSIRLESAGVNRCNPPANTQGQREPGPAR